MEILENKIPCLVCKHQTSDVIVSTKTMMGSDRLKWSFNQCSNCKMVFLSPRVKAEALGTYYTESYLPYRGASAWGKYAHLVEGDMQKIDLARVNTVKKYFDHQEGTVLDVGCGKPTFLKQLKSKSRYDCVGLDFSDEGRKAEPETYSSLRLFQGSIEDLPDHVQPDVITMWHYLEHDYNPIETLEFLKKRQKKSAILIIEVPNHDSYSRRKYGNYWSGYHSPRHTGLYTPATLKTLLENCGWEVIDQYTFGTLDPYTLDWMSRMEKEDIEWSASMENRLIGYVVGKMIRPIYYFHKYLSLGFMTMVARIKV